MAAEDLTTYLGIVLYAKQSWLLWATEVLSSRPLQTSAVVSEGEQSPPSLLMLRVSGFSRETVKEFFSSRTRVQEEERVRGSGEEKHALES